MFEKGDKVYVSDKKEVGEVHHKEVQTVYSVELPDGTRVAVPEGSSLQPGEIIAWLLAGFHIGRGIERYTLPLLDEEQEHIAINTIKALYRLDVYVTEFEVINLIKFLVKEYQKCNY